MSAKLLRLNELRTGGFDVTRIKSDSGVLEVSLHRRGITVVLTLQPHEAQHLLQAPLRKVLT